jgi:hypothetical protein
MTLAKKPTPVPILITIAALALYVALGSWRAFQWHDWLGAAFALVGAAAAISAALLRPWSRFLVYLVTLALMGSWFYSIHVSHALGYFRIYSRTQVLASLLPEGALVLLSGYCSYAVYRQFPRQGDTKSAALP